MGIICTWVFQVLSEVDLMFQRINREHEQGKEIHVAELLDINIGSIINNLLFGYRYDDDKLDEFWELKHFLTEMLRKSFHPAQILFQWKPNFFRRLPYLKGVFDDIRRKMKNFDDFFGRQIEMHMKEIDFTDLDTPSTDIVEAFLKEKARRDANGEKHGFT